MTDNMKMQATILALIFMIVPPCYATARDTISHFVFFSQEREHIHDPAFYTNSGVDGAQITYTWKKLEPQKDLYDFSEIEEDLMFLQSKGKRLFIQIQDVSFSTVRINVPQYIINNNEYRGGVYQQSWSGEDGKQVMGGWVARRWDPAVADRYRKLLIELAKRFDGRIEGINLPETSLDLKGPNGEFPEGYTSDNYVNEYKKTMLVMKNNFKRSVSILYANFMPEDSLNDLKKLYNYAGEIKMGMGGPDIKVYRRAQMKNSYPLIRGLSGISVTGVAVQDGNYSVDNPKTGKQVTINEILDFARNYLKLNYIFWCTEEPYYSSEVLPMLQKLSEK
jgi:competence protein ComGF